MLLIVFLGIIVSRKLYNISTFLCVLPRHIIRAYGNGCIALRVMFSDIPGKPSCNLLTMLIAMCIVYLISNAPHDYGDVVSVPSNPACHILVRPVDKKPCIVKFRLRKLPHIERFAVNQKAHLIRKLQHFLGRHIVRGTNGIYTHLPELVKLTPERIDIECSSEATVVVMLTHTVEPYLSPVENKSVLRRILLSTKTYLLTFFMLYLTLIL